MADDVKRKPGRPRKERKQLVETPQAFLADDEAGITDMQAAFVWHYTEGACGQTASAATKMLNGNDFPKVTRAVRVKQDELREKYAITPQKTGSMLWKIAETSFETGAYNAAVSAVKELNQLAGLTIHRSQNLNINADLQKMTKEDIKHRLNELLGVDGEMSDKDH